MNQNDPNAKKLTTLTRTDFLIQFIWQPPAPDAQIESQEEIRKKLAEAEADEKNKGAVPIPKEDDLAKLSEEKSKQLIEAVEKKVREFEAKAKAEPAKAASPKAPASVPGAAPAPTGPAGIVDPGAPSTAPGAIFDPGATPSLTAPPAKAAAPRSK